MKISKVIFHIKPIPSHPWWECKNNQEMSLNQRNFSLTVQQCTNLFDSKKFFLNQRNFFLVHVQVFESAILGFEFWKSNIRFIISTPKTYMKTVFHENWRRRKIRGSKDYLKEYFWNVFLWLGYCINIIILKASRWPFWFWESGLESFENIFTNFWYWCTWRVLRER